MKSPLIFKQNFKILFSIRLDDNSLIQKCWKIENVQNLVGVVYESFISIIAL